MSSSITVIRASASNTDSVRNETQCCKLSKSRIIERLIYVAVSSLAFFAHTTPVHAQGNSLSTDYPTKPVRILVGFAPGGGINVVARIAAQWFTESFGKPFVVDNRPGASGNIAASLVTKATPDGYTLLMTADVHTINASLFSKLPFDPVKDFAAIGTFASGPQLIAVHPSVPGSLAELITSAKANPGSIKYASAGAGTITHIAMEYFSSMAGIKLLHVPYKGSGASIIAVIGGEVPVLSIALGLALENAKSGKLRMLAVTSAARVQLAPDVPTVAEAAGLPGFEAVSWMGLLAPAGTPTGVINKLNAEIGRRLQTREVRDQFANRAWVPYPHTPTAFARKIKADITRWGKVVREAGAKTE